MPSTCIVAGCSCDGYYNNGISGVYTCWYHYKVMYEPSWLRNWPCRPIKNKVPGNGLGCKQHEGQK